MNIYMVRHGQTDLNVKRVYYGSTDCDINKTGILQAENLRNFFENIDVDLIISSDLKRAYHTAEIIKGNRNIDIVKEKGLREINFGDWENRTFKDIMENDPQNYKIWTENWLDIKFPNGESYMEFANRIENAFFNILEKYNNLKNILIVSHNGTLCSLLCSALDIGQKSFWHLKIEHGTYTMISVNDNYAVLEKYNSHINN